MPACDSIRQDMRFSLGVFFIAVFCIGVLAEDLGSVPIFGAGPRSNATVTGKPYSAEGRREWTRTLKDETHVSGPAVT